MTYNELYEQLKPYGCVAIYLTGATCLGLESHHDIDIAVYYKDKTKKEVLEQAVKVYKKYYDLHVRHIDSLNIHNDIFRPIWVTLYLFLQYKAGEEINPPYSLEQHIQTFKQYARMFRWEVFNPQHKWWYYLLLGLYVIINNEVTLTEEQLANLQLAHDKHMTQELRDWCINQLNN